MAAVSVVYDAGSAGRLNAAESATGWSGTASGIAAEPDYKYQGTYCISGQVKTAEVYVAYTNGSGIAFNGSPVKVWISKVIITNKDALDGNGIILRIGSTSSAYYYYNSVFTSTTYPIPGGWQIVPLDPNISGYRTGTTGSPNLGSVTYFAVGGDCNATSKAPNLGMDAVDYVNHGAGLTLTDGVGVSDGTYLDFVTFDEGTVGNRYGLVRTADGILYVLGVLTVGTSTATLFTDSNRVLVFPDGRFNTGFCGVDFGLQNASTIITLNSCTFIGRGRLNGFGGLASGSDTRPDCTVVGTSGTMNWTGCSFQSFRDITLTSAVIVEGCSFVNGVSLTPAGAPLTGCTFDRPSVATSTAYMQITNNLADIESCSFISSGTGHAIVITTAGEYAFVKNTFTDYATNAGTAGNRAIYNNSGGEVIINIDSGDTPSYTNGTGATTTINNTVTLTLTGIVNGSEVRILDAGTTTVRGGIEEVTGNSFAYGYSDSGSEVDIVIHKEEYIYYRINNFTLPGTSSSVPIAQQYDRQYLNPT